jgi:KDO2-lipid IV(A) lauroyltransferase
VTLAGAERLRLPAGARRPPRTARRRGRGTLAAWRAGEALVGRISPDAALRAGAWIGGASAVLTPGRFAALRDNLRHVVPGATEPEMDRLVRANARNLGRCWAEVMAMQAHGDELVSRVHRVNVEHMLAPLERGRGVLIASLHLGSWETGVACWNRRYGRMALLAEVLRPPELFEMILAGRRHLGIDVIPIDTAAMREADAAGDSDTARRLAGSAVRRVVRALRANQLVATAMDRDVIGNGVPMEFFGELAPIPLGLVDIVIRNGSAIVPIPLIRAGREIVAPVFPEIAYDASAPRDAEVRRVGAEILRIFESVIREHPDQWHVLEPIWR